MASRAGSTLMCSSAALTAFCNDERVNIEPSSRVKSGVVLRSSGSQGNASSTSVSSLAAQITFDGCHAR
eukprot:3076971-Prymnesium_polylepis.1